MKLLLDENVPKQLKNDLLNHQVFTSRELGWNGIEDTQVLQLLIDNHFDALITCDKNIQHQQNFRKYSVTVVVLDTYSNAYVILQRLTPQLKDLLDGNLPKGIVILKP
jgi:predicted nuclease of predicted toxin-antitoxin system